MWIAVGVAGGALVLSALILGVLHYCYSKKLGVRADRVSPGFRDRKAEEFPSLAAEPFSFVSDGITLRGFRYTGAEDNGKRIVFAHGIGAGHEAYLTEIAYFCGRGYEVFAFDFPGCVRSGGDALGGLHLSVPHFLRGVRFIREKWGEKEFFLAGHSWGGYTVSAAAGESGAKAVVEISGFVSPVKEYAALFGRWLTPWIALYLFLRFGKAGFIGVKACKVPILAVHGTIDRTVPLCASVAKSGLPNVEAYLCEGKAHNPYNTLGAERYLGELLEGSKRLRKASLAEREAFFAKIDYIKATEEDPVVMEKIVSFLERA